MTQRAVYRVPRESEEELVARLWQAGTSGVETVEEGDCLRVIAFFEEEPPALAGFATLESGEVAKEDWLARWRESAQPLKVGRRFLIDPREIDQPPPPAGRRVLLRIPARAAFGTGSHESTRLVLELMEGVDFSDRAVLDVGTGTGVLALAALALGARSAFGFDVDLVSPILAKQNADLNRIGGHFFAGDVAALGAPAKFDVALVNVIPEEIRSGLQPLRQVMAPGARAIFSGILREPLNGQEAVLPVDEAVRHWFASPRAAVNFLLHAAGLDTSKLGSRRSLTMPGLSATVGEEIEALRRAAGEKAVGLIRREPDETVARIVAGWPQNFDASRAEALGFSAEKSFDEIIAAYLEEERGAVVPA